MGLFIDPNIVRERVRQEELQRQMQMSQLFGQQAGQAQLAQQLGSMLGQGVNKLFGRNVQDPRVVQAEKMAEISRNVATKFKGQSFDPGSTEQLTALRDELLKGGFINQAVEVGDMIRAANKTLAEIEQKQAAAGQAEALTDESRGKTEERQRLLDLGMPEAQVESEKALAQRRKRESDVLGNYTQPSSVKLNAASTLFEANYPKLWGGLDETQRAAVAVQIDTLSRTLEKSVGPAIAQKTALDTVASQLVNEPTTIMGWEVPFTSGTTVAKPQDTSGGAGQTNPAPQQSNSQFRPRAR